MSSSLEEAHSLEFLQKVMPPKLSGVSCLLLVLH